MELRRRTWRARARPGAGYQSHSPIAATAEVSDVMANGVLKVRVTGGAGEGPGE